MLSLKATYRRRPVTTTSTLPPTTTADAPTAFNPSQNLNVTSPLELCKLRLEESEIRLLQCSTIHHKDLLALDSCNERIKDNKELSSCKILANNCTDEIIDTRIDLGNCLAQNVGLRFEVNAWASKCGISNKDKIETATTTTTTAVEMLPTAAPLIRKTLSPTEEWNFMSCMQELQRVKVTLVGCKHANAQLVYNSSKIN